MKEEKEMPQVEDVRIGSDNVNVEGGEKEIPRFIKLCLGRPGSRLFLDESKQSAIRPTLAATTSHLKLGLRPLDLMSH